MWIYDCKETKQKNICEKPMETSEETDSWWSKNCSFLAGIFFSHGYESPQNGLLIDTNNYNLYLGSTPPTQDASGKWRLIKIPYTENIAILVATKILGGG